MNSATSFSDAVATIHIFWIVAWFVVVAALTAALLFLAASRWGRSKPLRICVVLSLLAHALMAGYAATIRIAAARAAKQQFVEIDIGDDIVDTQEELTKQQPKPWETFPSRPPDLAATPMMAAAEGPTAHSAIPGNVALPLRTPMPPKTITAPDHSTSQFFYTSAKEAEPLRAPQAQKQIPDNSKNQPAPELLKPYSPNDAANDPSSIPREPVPEFSASKPSAALPPLPKATSSDLLASKQAIPAQPLDLPQPPQATRDQGGQTSSDTESSEMSDLGFKPKTPDRPLTQLGTAVPDVDFDALDRNQDLPSIYKFRKAPEREKLGGRLGGSRQTEDAVKLGLRWLAAAQNADGRWIARRWGGGQAVTPGVHNRQQAGLQADHGVTGLALLAFLASGHTHMDQSKYRQNVADGLQFLLDHQKANGSLAGEAGLYAAMYCHGMATFAISEAYAMTNDERLRGPVVRAVNYILASQDPLSGGWRYKMGDPGDTSQLGWQVMALKSAEVAGISIPAQTQQGIHRFLLSVSSGRYGGLASYRPGQRPSHAMTAEALFCRHVLGTSPQDPKATEAAQYLLAELPGSERQRGERLNLYYYYYATLALHQRQGEYWDRWNRAMQDTLISAQQRDGDHLGSWAPDSVWGAYGGRVYTTALATLCLEVYYRFLPLHAELP